MTVALSGIGSGSLSTPALRPQPAGVSSVSAPAPVSAADNGTSTAADASSSAPQVSLDGSVSQGMIEQDIDTFLYNLQTAVLRLEVFR